MMRKEAESDDDTDDEADEKQRMLMHRLAGGTL